MPHGGRGSNSFEFQRSAPALGEQDEGQTHAGPPGRDAARATVRGTGRDAGGATGRGTGRDAGGATGRDSGRAA